MSFRLNTAARDALANQVAQWLCDGASGTFKIYSGAQPATADTAASDTLLYSSTEWGGMGSPSGGTMPIDTAGGSAAASATGTCGWVRWGGATYGSVDGTCGISGTDFIVNSAATASGTTVTIGAINITQPIT